MAESFNVFDAVSRRMKWLEERQGVLSKNIANADTPDYKPRAMKDPEFVGALQRELAPMQPQVTDAGHINASVPEAQTPEAEEQDETYETAPNGNAVVIEEQMVKVADTQQSHRAMTNVYRKYMDMFRIAWGSGGGGG